jgi:hypothetical protein
VLKPDEFALGAPAMPKGRAKAVNLLSSRDEPDDAQDTDTSGHVVPDIIPFVAADAKGEVHTAKGASMPRGVYDRTKSKKRKGAEAAAPAGGEEKPRKAHGKSRARAAAGAKPRRPREATPPAGEERFAVWSDGTVDIDAPECKGRLNAATVASLYEYVKRLRGEA